MFKYIDTSNFVLLTKNTKQSKDYLSLYLINGITGEIRESFFQDKISFSHSISLNVHRNGIFVSFFNSKSLQYQLWCIEFYYNSIENSYIDLLKKYYTGGLKKEIDPHGKEDYKVFQQNYYFSEGIQTYTTIKTRQGITKQNLLLVTSNS